MKASLIRFAIAITLANILSQTALHIFGAMAGIIVGVVGGLLLGFLSQLPLWHHD